MYTMNKSEYRQLMKKYVELNSFSLDKNSPAALHLQLAGELLKQLRALPPNGNNVLPSERALVRQFEINRLTVHRAYAYLLENGLVVRNPDKSLSVASTARRQLQGAFPVIGIILPEKFSAYSRRPMAMEYLKGIIDRGTELGVSTMMLNPPAPGTAKDVTDDFIETHCAKLSGIIHLGDRGLDDDDVLEKILDYTGVPQIFISAYSDRGHIGSVCADITPGMTALCEAIRKKGAKTVGIISKTFDSKRQFVYNFSLRTKQAKEIFESNGLEVSFVRKFPSREDIGIDPEQLPDVLWCFNDDYAKALLKVLERHDIRVPEDVMVCGFDGFATEFEGRKISSVVQQFYTAGYNAVDLVMEHFRFGVTPENKEIKIETFYVSGDTL